MTRGPASSNRRGTALLVVLAVTVLTVSALLLVARATAAATVARHTAAAARVADDLLLAADAPIRRWLATAAADVVLPPDAETPRVPVLHDEWPTVELVITAWDQCGMVPVEAARGSMRSAIPDPDVRTIVESVKVARGQAAGLDLFVEAARPIDGAVVFPAAEDPEPPAADVAGETVHRAVGAVVATHNPAPGRINVNTAPMALVEHAMKLAGRGGVELIVDARSTGERFIPPAPPAEPRGRRGARPQIAGTSNAWAFRVDGTVSGLSRSWWCVYRQAKDNEPWECEQRLAILD